MLKIVKKESANFFVQPLGRLSGDSRCPRVRLNNLDAKSCGEMVGSTATHSIDKPSPFHSLQPHPDYFRAQDFRGAAGSSGLSVNSRDRDTHIWS